MADVRAVIMDTWDRESATLARSLAVAADAASSATSRQVLELLRVFERNVARAERQAFFERLGERAHSAVITSYKSRRRGPSGYRADTDGGERYRRYAGGRMLAALQNPDHIYIATPDGITFLPNPRKLDAKAKQWYRLNFGARPGFGSAPRRFDVSISNIFLFSLGFDAGPSEPFRIPRGFWVERGEAVGAGPAGTSAFYPRKSPQTAALGLVAGDTKEEQKATPNFFPGRSIARGITAEHWLDAGLKRFTEDLRDPGSTGIGLRSLYVEFYRRGLASVRPTRPPTINVTGTRLRP